VSYRMPLSGVDTAARCCWPKEPLGCEGQTHAYLQRRAARRSAVAPMLTLRDKSGWPAVTESLSDGIGISCQTDVCVL
jgi:hypothetical protein